MNFEYNILLSITLFSIGIGVVITKRNAIMVLIGIELIFNAANINLVTFSQQDPDMSGQLFVLFVILVAAAETAIALAIIINVYRKFKSTDIDKINFLKG